MNIKLNYSKMELTQNKNINRILSYIFIFVMIFRKRAIRMKMLYQFQSYVFRSDP